MFATGSFDVTLKTAEQNLVVRISKSEAAMTNNNRLRSRGVVLLKLQRSSKHRAASLRPVSDETFDVYAGAAGLIVSVNRIITKAMMRDVRASTLLFFGISIAFVVVCCVAFHLTRCTEFVQFYVSMCRSSAVSDDQRAIMRPSNEPAASEEVSLVSVFESNLS